MLARTAAVAGEQPDADADHGRDQRRAEADLEIGSGRVDEARERVAADLVRAEPEVVGRRRERSVEQIGRAVRGDQPGKQRREDERQQQQEPDLEPDVVPEPAHQARLILGSTIRYAISISVETTT